LEEVFSEHWMEEIRQDVWIGCDVMVKIKRDF